MCNQHKRQGPGTESTLLVLQQVIEAKIPVKYPYFPFSCATYVYMNITISCTPRYTYRLLLTREGCIIRTARERDVITYLLWACASSIIATAFASSISPSNYLKILLRDVEGAFATRAVSSFLDFDYALKTPSKGPGSTSFCVHGAFSFGELSLLRTG